MRRALSVLLLLLFSAGAGASSMVGDMSDLPEAKQPESEKNFSGMLGVAVLSKPEYSGSDENEVVAAPLISLDYKDTVYFKFNRAGVWFWKPKDTGVRFGALVKPRKGWSSGDGDSLKGMDDRDDSIEAGVNMEWKIERAKFEAGYLTDVSDKSDGNSGFFKFNYALVQQPKFQLMGLVGFEHLDKDVSNYYYGVKGSEATASRPAYKADADWIYSLGLVAMYGFAERWTLIGGAVYSRLGDEMDDSPIVEDRNNTLGALGVAWRF